MLVMAGRAGNPGLIPLSVALDLRKLVATTPFLVTFVHHGYAALARPRLGRVTGADRSFRKNPCFNRWRFAARKAAL
jgi:hypothetical protein